MPPLEKTPLASLLLLAGVQDIPAISASARCRAARGRENRRAISEKLRFCGAGSSESTLLLFPRFGRLVRPSRKAAEECLRLVSRKPALDARGIDVGWLA